MTSATPALRFHALMLGVSDLDASISFYVGVLGWELSGRFGDFAFITPHPQAPDSAHAGTALVLSAQLARARPGGTPAPVEVVLGVDGVVAAYDVLRARGVTFANEPRTIDGANHGVNFTDPDGHLFSLFGPP